MLRIIYLLFQVLKWVVICPFVIIESILSGLNSILSAVLKILGKIDPPIYGIEVFIFILKLLCYLILGPVVILHEISSSFVRTIKRSLVYLASGSPVGPLLITVSSFDPRIERIILNHDLLKLFGSHYMHNGEIKIAHDFNHGIRHAFLNTTVDKQSNLVLLSLHGKVYNDFFTYTGIERTDAVLRDLIDEGMKDDIQVWILADDISSMSKSQRKLNRKFGKLYIMGYEEFERKLNKLLRGV